MKTRIVKNFNPMWLIDCYILDDIKFDKKYRITKKEYQKKKLKKKN